MPGVHEQAVAGRTGATSAISTVACLPSSRAHSASPRSSSTRTTVIGTPSSPQVMQCCEPQVGVAHSITLAFSSSSSCS